MAAAACGGPAQVRYEEELARTPEGAQHAVHDARLRELMAGLGRLRTERLPQNLDVGVEAEARGAQVADVALAMADSASQIADTGAGRLLEGAQRQEFEGLAAGLERSLRRLAERARRRPPGDLEAELAAVEATCIGCHARFRDVGLRDSP